MRTIRWKNFMSFTVEGKPTKISADVYDHHGVGFLQQIQAMPRKRALAWEAAVVLYAHTVFQLMMDTSGYVAADWINEKGGFLGCISDLGYHITLRGDEYELK
jgi:hypothetical protein